MDNYEQPKRAQVTFRAPEDVRDWIEDQKAKTGKNKEEIILEALNSLILKRAQEEFPSRGVETAEFEMHINAIQRMYVASIEMCEHTTDRVRMEFAKELERNKALLDEKMEQIKSMKEKMADLAGAADECVRLRKALDEATEETRRMRLDYEERLSDKSRALKETDARVKMLEIKADGYDDLKADRDKQVADLVAKTREHEFALKMAQKDAEQKKEAAVAAAVVAAKSEKDAEIASLKEQLQDAKVQAKEELRQAENKAHEAEKKAAEKFNAEIRRLEGEKAQLLVQVAALQAKMPKDE